MSSKYILNNVSNRVNTHMHKTAGRLREMQPTPVGTEARSDRERSAMWKKMRELSPEHFDALMNTIAKTIGPEQVAQFISEQVKREHGKH